MAVVPLLVNLSRELDSMSSNLDHMLDDDFGFGIHPMEIFRMPRHQHHHHRGALLPSASRRRHTTPYDRWPLNTGRRALRSTAQSPALAGADGFQVCVDVGQFKPNELVVKVVGQSIVVEGKHEEREDDHGFISRHFVRRYALPEGYESEKVMSTLSSDGVLTLTVPKPPAIEENGKAERIVQIQQVGPAHLNVKKNEDAEGAADDQDRGEVTKAMA